MMIQKQKLRTHLKQVRDQLFVPGTLIYQKKAENLLAQFYEVFSLKRPFVVAGYIPKGSEIDVMPLLTRLFNEGHCLALPRVEGDLIFFHNWGVGEPLHPNLLHILEPSSLAPKLDPEIILVPLLGFDEKGNRLGYGKGFYDRALEPIKGKKHCITVGVGYNEQMIHTIPVEAHDTSLDMIITDSFFLKTSEHAYSFLR